MEIEMRTKLFTLDIHGFSGTAVDRDYAGTAFKLMDKMWKIVKSNNLSNKGLNIWVYEPDEKVFTGVELLQTPKQETALEHKIITLEKYAYFKHIGPYGLIKKSGQQMRDVLKSKGLKTISPYIEIYGHWSNDESKLETELIMAVE